MRTAALVAGALLGMPAAAVLVVNNYRDIDNDRRAGRRTFAVVFGARASRIEYAVLMLLPFLLLLPLAWLAAPAGWLPLLAAPVGARAGAAVPHAARRGGVQPLLADTARLQLAFGALICIGLLSVAWMAESSGGCASPTLRLFPYAIPLSRPWKCARGDTVLRRGWLVRIEDTEGAHGWGETAGLPGAGTETAGLAGRSTGRGIDAWPGLDVDEARSRLPDRDRPAARCGLECALLDLAARRAGLPLYRYLRPDAVGEVRVNAFVGAVDEGLGERLVAARAQGFEVAKLKLATAPLADELPRFFAAMERLPAGLSLRLDVNRGWTTAEAEATCRCSRSADRGARRARARRRRRGARAAAGDGRVLAGAR
jgi:hypothetical protein